jgi:hypothetical protein
MAIEEGLEMADAAVLVATAFSIFGAPALALLCAMLDFRRRARAAAPPRQRERKSGSGSLSSSPRALTVFVNGNYVPPALRLDRGKRPF